MDCGISDHMKSGTGDDPEVVHVNGWAGRKLISGGKMAGDGEISISPAMPSSLLTENKAVDEDGRVVGCFASG